MGAPLLAIGTGSRLRSLEVTGPASSLGCRCNVARKRGRLSGFVVVRCLLAEGVVSGCDPRAPHRVAVVVGRSIGALSPLISTGPRSRPQG